MAHQIGSSPNRTLTTLLLALLSVAAGSPAQMYEDDPETTEFSFGDNVSACALSRRFARLLLCARPNSLRMDHIALIAFVSCRGPKIWHGLPALYHLPRNKMALAKISCDLARYCLRSSSSTREDTNWSRAELMFSQSDTLRVAVLSATGSSAVRELVRRYDARSLMPKNRCAVCKTSCS